MREISVDRVHYCDFLIKNNIRVVRHAVRDMVMTLKKIDLMVINAYISDLVRKIHGDLLCLGKSIIQEIVHIVFNLIC